MNYYNEWDAYTAEWLRELIERGLIPKGEVDERSITEVTKSDLAGFIQCHFFAGIGGWSYALALAGVGADRPVWTGSCPCQPYSVAGKRNGDADARNLWPEFYRLIAECRPPVVFGEQVEGAVKHGWLDGICADLEKEDYAFGAHVLGAHSVGAPHIRQRLFWVGERRMADAGSEGLEGRQVESTWEERATAERSGGVGEHTRAIGLDARSADDSPGVASGLVNAQGEQARLSGQPRQPRGADTERLEHTPCNGRIERRPESSGRRLVGGCGESNPWSDFDIVHCIDGKARRAGSGIFPLAHGVSARVGKLRAAGNAINPYAAAEFIKAYQECRNLR